MRRATKITDWGSGLRVAAMVALMSGAGALAACGSSSDSSSSNAAGSSNASTAAPQVAHVDVILKTDADSGAPGTYTSKSGWPAFSPSEINVPANSTVVLTIKDYDAAATPLPDGSPWGQVKGGTETVDGTAVTSVGNDKIAHTFSVPSLGLNAPIPMAPDGGFTTVVFTFHTGAAGTFTWECYTPCGGDPNGMGGAMATDGWMRGHLIVG